MTKTDFNTKIENWSFILSSGAKFVLDHDCHNLFLGLQPNPVEDYMIYYTKAYAFCCIITENY